VDIDGDGLLTTRGVAVDARGTTVWMAPGTTPARPD
jgi:hypothetical protein